MVSKHDFVLGAVSHHNHGSVVYTSVELGHVHYYDFYISEDYGHRHHVKGVDHPAPGNQ